MVYVKCQLALRLPPGVPVQPAKAVLKGAVKTVAMIARLVIPVVFVLIFVTAITAMKPFAMPVFVCPPPVAKSICAGAVAVIALSAMRVPVSHHLAAKSMLVVPAHHAKFAMKMPLAQIMALVGQLLVLWPVRREPVPVNAKFVLPPVFVRCQTVV